jgi:hypothetical protein
MIYCKTLLDIRGLPLRALLVQGTPLVIPEGQEDPRTAPGDEYYVRLYEFEADETPGKLVVALYLHVEQASFLDEAPVWEDKEPWLFRLLWTTGNQPRLAKKDIRASMGFTVEDQPRNGSREALLFWEREALGYGNYTEDWQGCAADEHFDEAVEDALMQAKALTIIPGASLDQMKNAFGATGWQRIVGDYGIPR